MTSAWISIVRNSCICDCTTISRVSFRQLVFHECSGTLKSREATSKDRYWPFYVSITNNAYAGKSYINLRKLHFSITIALSFSRRVSEISGFGLSFLPYAYLEKDAEIFSMTVTQRLRVKIMYLKISTQLMRLLGPYPQTFLREIR